MVDAGVDRTDSAQRFFSRDVGAGNFAVKRGGDVLAARLVFAATVAAVAAPFAPLVPPPPRALWPALAGAVAVHWLYQFAMIRALHRGELSAVFPVMRGLAPLFTAATAYAFLNEALTPLAFVGLVVACAALFVFGMPPRAAAARRLHVSSLVWAGLTAIGISFYSVVDAAVARAMPSPYTFIVWLFLFDWIGVAVVAVAARRGALLAAMRPQLKNGVLGGVAGAFSYGAAILAFTLTDVALVTAMRETAGFFAALLGVVFLKESFGLRRVAAAAALAVGLAMLRIGA